MTSDAGGAPLVHTGVDVVSVDRIESLVTEFGDSFLERVYTDAEQRYCRRQGTPAEHYAARWAAKEAFLKLLGDRARTVPVGAVGVRTSGERPHLELDRAARAALAATLADAGADVETADRSVSLSHDRESGVAMASVVVVAARERGRC